MPLCPNAVMQLQSYAKRKTADGQQTKAAAVSKCAIKLRNASVEPMKQRSDIQQHEVEQYKQNVTGSRLDEHINSLW